MWPWSGKYPGSEPGGRKSGGPLGGISPSLTNGILCMGGLAGAGGLLSIVYSVKCIDNAFTSLGWQKVIYLS